MTGTAPYGGSRATSITALKEPGRPPIVAPLPPLEATAAERLMRHYRDSSEMVEHINGLEQIRRLARQAAEAADDPHVAAAFRNNETRVDAMFAEMEATVSASALRRSAAPNSMLTDKR